MAQPYAGRDHGMHFPLHKGTEVLLTFIDGDPDRPIIQSAVPNPETQSPVNVNNQTMSAITTAGGNKIHIEDQAGSEGFSCTPRIRKASSGRGPRMTRLCREMVMMKRQYHGIGTPRIAKFCAGLLDIQAQWKNAPSYSANRHRPSIFFRIWLVLRSAVDGVFGGGVNPHFPDTLGPQKRALRSTASTLSMCGPGTNGRGNETRIADMGDGAQRISR